jgi:lipoate-protein ligase B
MERGSFTQRLSRLLITLASARRIEGRTGVWISEQKRIASIGVAVRSWITFDALALNISTNLSCFSTINPRGYDNGAMTSMTEQLGRPVSVSETRGRLSNALARILATELETTCEKAVTGLE